MMKTTSSYKMKRQTKIFLAKESDPHRRGDLKRLFMAAEMIAAVKPKIDKKDLKED